MPGSLLSPFYLDALASLDFKLSLSQRLTFFGKKTVQVVQIGGWGGAGRWEVIWITSNRKRVFFSGERPLVGQLFWWYKYPCYVNDIS